MSKWTKLGLVLVLAAGSASAEIVVDRVAVDSIRGRSQDEVAYPLEYIEDSYEDTVGVMGGGGQRRDHNVVYRYALPTLPDGFTIESFTFSFEVTGLRNRAYDELRLDVVLLDVDDPTDTGTSLFYHGPHADDDTPGDHALVGNYYYDTDGDTDNIELDPPEVVTFTVESGAALTLLQGFYDDEDEPNQVWASFRFNLDKEGIDLGNADTYNRYFVNDDVATSSFTIIPEPSTTGLLAVFAGAALLRRRLRR